MSISSDNSATQTAPVTDAPHPHSNHRDPFIRQLLHNRAAFEKALSAAERDATRPDVWVLAAGSGPAIPPEERVGATEDASNWARIRNYTLAVRKSEAGAPEFGLLVSSYVIPREGARSEYVTNEECITSQASELLDRTVEITCRQCELDRLPVDVDAFRAAHPGVDEHQIAVLLDQRRREIEKTLPTLSASPRGPDIG